MENDPEKEATKHTRQESINACDTIEPATHREFGCKRQMSDPSSLKKTLLNPAHNPGKSVTSGLEALASTDKIRHAS